MTHWFSDLYASNECAAVPPYDRMMDLSIPA
jgi:hypothetical protein